MEELFDYLEDMIRVFVMAQYDLVQGLSCLDCSESDKCDNHCGFVYKEPAEEMLYLKTTDKEYSHCPISMIPRIIYQWYDEYTLLKEFNSPMYPHNTSLLFWWFVKTYKRIVNEVESKIHEDRMKQMNKSKK